MARSATLDVCNALLRVYATIRIWPARRKQYARGKQWIIRSSAQVAMDAHATAEAQVAAVGPMGSRPVGPELVGPGSKSPISEVLRASATWLSGNEPLYHYCIIRPDLPRGVEGSQIGHAYARSNHLGEQLPANTHNVLLSSCKRSACLCNGVHLLEVEQYCIANGVRHISIREPDLPWDGALLAIGINPGPRALIGPYFKHLKCIR